MVPRHLGPDFAGAKPALAAGEDPAPSHPKTCSGWKKESPDGNAVQAGTAGAEGSCAAPRVLHENVNGVCNRGRGVLMNLGWKSGKASLRRWQLRISLKEDRKVR